MSSLVHSSSSTSSYKGSRGGGWGGLEPVLADIGQRLCPGQVAPPPLFSSLYSAGRVHIHAVHVNGF